MDLKEYLELGKIVSTRGLKGEVKVQYYCDDADFFENFDYLYLGKEREEMKIEYISDLGNTVGIKFENIDTIEDAQKLRNKILYINRKQVELEDGCYFFDDLLNLSVVDENTGYVYGKITDVQHTGANDIYEVTKEKKSTWIPAIEQVVKSVDLEKGEMKITPMKGLFEDEN